MKIHHITSTLKFTTRMKRFFPLFFAATSIGSLFVLFQSCAPTKEIAEKSGSQLWSENCVRCHNAPPSSAYSNEQWHTLLMHMRVRARLTGEEANKILDFMQVSNQ